MTESVNIKILRNILEDMNLEYSVVSETDIQISTKAYFLWITVKRQSIIGNKNNLEFTFISNERMTSDKVMHMSFIAYSVDENWVERFVWQKEKICPFEEDSRYAFVWNFLFKYPIPEDIVLEFYPDSTKIQLYYLDKNNERQPVDVLNYSETNLPDLFYVILGKVQFAKTIDANVQESFTKENNS